MTTTDLVEKIDRRINEIREETGRLTAARTALTNGHTTTAAATGHTRRPCRPERPSRPARARTGREQRGGTRDAVLSRLRAAEGPLTASEVAKATGLGRASVSTTLSKLARNGTIRKAEHGYQAIAA